jgi:hypothetical protein
MNPISNNREVLLQELQQKILPPICQEFRKQIELLEGNQKIANIAEDLFEDAPMSLEKYRRTDMGSKLEKCFIDLILELKDVIGAHFFHNPKISNLSQRVSQYHWFIDVLCCLKNYEKNEDTEHPIKDSINEIVKYIFTHKENRRMYKVYETWAPSLKIICDYSYKNYLNYEPYYSKGICEVIRTIRNKENHPEGFARSFVPEFNFHTEFYTLFSVYVISLYAFIEMIEAFTSNMDFMKELGLIQ